MAAVTWTGCSGSLSESELTASSEPEEFVELSDAELSALPVTWESCDQLQQDSHVIYHN